MRLNTYLHFGGNCAEALRFYERHLGGKILGTMNYGEMPEPKNFPPGMETAVMHARIVIGDTTLMASDTPPESFQPMRSAYLVLGVDSNEEAERVYALLCEGGETVMPLGETFFAFRFAMLRDKFGTPWMIVRERRMTQ
jgi:PhnB protein